MSAKTKPRASQDTAADSAIVIHANYELFVLAMAVVSLLNAVLLLMPISGEERRIVVAFIGGISLFCWSMRRALCCTNAAISWPTMAG